MSLTRRSRHYSRFLACLSLSLGPAMVAVDAAGTEPRTARAQTARPGAQAKPAKTAKPAKLPAAKQKAPAAAAAQPDEVTELEIINGEAIALSGALAAAPDDTELRQKLALLALRAARAAERVLSRGDDDLFTAYRAQFRKHFAATRPGLESMAARGVGAAEFALGVIDLHGMPGERDVARACAHFAAALDRGFAGARFRHARCIEQKAPERAAALMREAADAGHVGAMEQLGRSCLDARPPDAACARTRLERAAREGHPERHHAAGLDASRRHRRQGGPGACRGLLPRGRRDLLAALAGFPPAQFNLGRLFATGQGTARDLEQARHWLGEAAKAGIAPARLLLDHLDREAAAK
jgi:TPR repeat protein